jgi:hypothetical protein
MAQKITRYVHGGTSTSTPTLLKWWERTVFPKSNNDQFVLITGKYVGRPDLMAYALYGQSQLGWLILQYNNIVDVVTEFTEGRTVRVPTKTRVSMNILAR